MEGCGLIKAWNRHGRTVGRAGEGSAESSTADHSQ